MAERGSDHHMKHVARKFGCAIGTPLSMAGLEKSHGVQTRVGPPLTYGPEGGQTMTRFESQAGDVGANRWLNTLGAAAAGYSAGVVTVVHSMLLAVAVMAIVDGDFVQSPIEATAAFVAAAIYGGIALVVGLFVGWEVFVALAIGLVFWRHVLRGRIVWFCVALPIALPALMSLTGRVPGQSRMWHDTVEIWTFLSFSVFPSIAAAIVIWLMLRPTPEAPGAARKANRDQDQASVVSSV